MLLNFLKENLKKTILIANCLVFLFASYLLAADNVEVDKENELSALQQQARLYRIQGVKFQEAGDLDSALKMYQKAAELDPAYAVVYNDLGIVYEAQGEDARAEESYLKALTIDPVLLSACTNLALLYENKRQLEKAVYYWKKRAELGDPNDPWTMKAQQRLEDVQLALSSNPLADVQERDVNNLVREVSNNLAGAKTK